MPRRGVGEAMAGLKHGGIYILGVPGRSKRHYALFCPTKFGYTSYRQYKFTTSGRRVAMTIDRKRERA